MAALVAAENGGGEVLMAGSGDASGYSSKDLSAVMAAAEQGDALAQCELGLRYGWGTGGAVQDFDQAAQWMRKAAGQGNAEAQLKLGVLYSLGQGVKLDYGQAFAWYEKAAKQGNAEAQGALGFFYLEGKGVSQDAEKGFAWLEKAAQQGFAPAKEILRQRASSALPVPGDTLAPLGDAPPMRDMFQEAFEQGKQAE